jgi:hypothetical protein
VPRRGFAAHHAAFEKSPEALAFLDLWHYLWVKRGGGKPAPWKSPKAELSRYARESRRVGGIPSFSTALTAAISFFLISPQKQE